jgi:hypothetical protein
MDGWMGDWLPHEERLRSLRRTDPIGNQQFQREEHGRKNPETEGTLPSSGLPTSSRIRLHNVLTLSFLQTADGSNWELGR